jgi:hypothetical protein
MRKPPLNAQFTKITVNFEVRDDGGLRAYSPDVPGFVLSHPDIGAVLADIKPALETILSAMWGIPVVASPLTSLNHIDEDDEGDSIPAAHICPKEYVAYAS